jgi:FkbM family methyltransferase
MNNTIDINVLIGAFKKVAKNPSLVELYLSKSRGQLQQDLFALVMNNFKRNGFFVEFGATDGKALSNTYILEKEFAWSGILAEPCRVWYPALIQNRECYIEHKCVWTESGMELIFNETAGAQISTIDIYSDSDFHSAGRVDGKRYAVKTISLVDLLDKFSAPSEIDYLSIDTEGSEFDILQAFPFSKYTFKTITCEHNFSKSREKIHTLLSQHGYRRVLQEFSQFDDWYVLEGS